MIYRIKESEIKNLRELFNLAEEHDILVITRGESESSLVLAIDEKFIKIFSCISFLENNGFKVGLAERIPKGS